MGHVSESSEAHPYQNIREVTSGLARSNTVMILRFRRDRSGQTVQTQISLLLQEQSDQGLHCLQCCLHPLDVMLYGKATLFKFKGDYSKLYRCPNV